ncbi:MAG TPA: aminotransferase class V-fold PLP-dependent enzyme [Vicinamibacteria bacterium]|nr:aminotransferase class V-fold PLP-dependent enzyme [Vicinamibacteria bacterium]
MERREFLKSVVTAPVVGGRSQRAVQSVSASLEDNVYTRLLGVRPHLGAHEHISRLGGSRMHPDVIEALVEANRYFVDMNELTEAAGKRVAELLGAEAALVTAGGFSSMILGAAACLTGIDPDKVDALPHPTWLRRECLIQSEHRFSYDRAYRAAGMVIVEAKNREELERKISDKTAMIAVLAAVEEQREFGPPKPRKRALPPEPLALMPEELIAIGKRAGVPVLVDMASDLPPASNLTRWVREGADLVVISGGKGLLGPQSTGILAGREDLIAAARQNAAPNGNIGRGMKVGKEEVIALVVALDRYTRLDHNKEIESWNEKARWLEKELSGIPGVRAEYAVNTKGYADIDLSWDENVIGLSHEELRERLMAGSPRMTYDGTTVRVRQLTDDELVVVARRLRQVLEAAKSG